MDDHPSRLRACSRVATLRCPRCGVGPLFRSWFRMHEACPHCGFSYDREAGFYLGSIYLNYGATVILTGSLYAALVMGPGLSGETSLAVCLTAAVSLYFAAAGTADMEPCPTAAASATG